MHGVNNVWTVFAVSNPSAILVTDFNIKTLRHFRHIYESNSKHTVGTRLMTALQKQPPNYHTDFDRIK
jgi:hypothetical protein